MWRSSLNVITYSVVSALFNTYPAYSFHTFSSVQSRNGALADGISETSSRGVWRTTWVSSKLSDRFLIFDTVARRRPRNRKSVFHNISGTGSARKPKISRVDREHFRGTRMSKELGLRFLLPVWRTSEFFDGTKTGGFLAGVLFKICKQDQRYCTKNERNCAVNETPIIQVKRFGRQGAPKSGHFSLFQG